MTIHIRSALGGVVHECQTSQPLCGRILYSAVETDDPVTCKGCLRRIEARTSPEVAR
ncbi:hypothetical protein VSH64_25045 [Amycolatopsis rhabdoformis]|uniref:Uncharacterized protein n=1 Tax=Amycolatopsis rhabdoformis TaxID=1448059 RepID=A0ABZ1HUZ0_9PSEU|nr:hypothetical protein [Amycolatopsis rhabdoformis]WSE26145.1 hypothetical protein VSH64_25045 [Amycolatopsis rhabdoformis]